MARAYSENSLQSEQTIRQMSLSPPPLAELGGGWTTPEPSLRVRTGTGMGTGVVPGHYPPPLVEGMAEVRTVQGPEMKEVRGPGENRGFGGGD
jgi:hypothetical protein